MLQIHLVTVILMRSGLPEKVYVLSGFGSTSEQAGDLAEAKFRELINEYALPRSLDEDEAEEAIADGHIELPGTEYEIFLVWPEVSNDIVK